EESRKHLLAPIARVEADGATIPLTNAILLLVDFYEDAYSLSPQDALVLASVKSHAERCGGPKCFVTKDKDLNKPAIREELGVEFELLMNLTPPLLTSRMRCGQELNHDHRNRSTEPTS
ncbi:MAG: hypothetical protein JO088_23725, partial [Acidobacteria bacterium]|nr:hypothetical protein [Acidobacteriota bacterium]